MSLRRLVLPFASLVAFSFGACNDGTASPTLNSGLPGSTQVDNLSDSQAQQLCRAFETYANQLMSTALQKQLHCVAAGALAQGTGTTTCQSTYDSCMKETAYTGTTITLSCTNATAADLGGCTATVDQLTACANEIAATVQPLLDGLNCSVVTDPTAQQQYASEITAATNGTSVSACSSLPATCSAYAQAIANKLPTN